MRHKLPFLLFALVITTARAEIWTPIDEKVSFDHESVDQADSALPKVTWRTKDGNVTYTLISEVNCAIGMIDTERGFMVVDNMVQESLGPAELDFLTRTRTQKGKVTPMDSYLLEWMHRFPSPNTGEGRLVAHVCNTDLADIARRSRDAFAGSLCKDKAASERYLCKMDDRGHLEMRHLMNLVALTSEACGTTSEEVGRVRMGWTKESMRCGRNDESCLRAIADKARRVSQDLSRSLRGEACTFMPKAQGEIDQAEAQESAWGQFGKCVKERVVALDDGLSSADVVARAVFTQCRSLTPESLSPNVAQSAVDSITAKVLENRQDKRSAATQKKR